MTQKMIIDAYCHIRKIDNTIPDEVLDFMKDAALEKLLDSQIESHIELTGKQRIAWEQEHMELFKQDKETHFQKLS